MKLFCITLMTNLFIHSSQAQTAPAGGAPGTMAMLFPFIAMFGIMYFLMIRPQQKKMKLQQEMLSKLQSGDNVLTSFGVIGVIKEIQDKIVTLEVDKGVAFKVVKSQIASKLTQGQTPELSQ